MVASNWLQQCLVRKGGVASDLGSANIRVLYKLAAWGLETPDENQGRARVYPLAN